MTGERVNDLTLKMILVRKIDENDIVHNFADLKSISLSNT